MAIPWCNWPATPGATSLTAGIAGGYHDALRWWQRSGVNGGLVLMLLALVGVRWWNGCGGSSGHVGDFRHTVSTGGTFVKRMG